MAVVLSRLYGAVAEHRRRQFERDPGARRRLRRPVVSVGGLTVGGSGKTPVAAHVATTLASLGERPALLSRGYGRQDRLDGVVVVRNPDEILAGLAEAGDEPLMLARMLPGISVLVSEDRYLAGLLAETTLGATVHILDDGFQHHALHRNVDIVVMTQDDLKETETLPAGRLREPIRTASRADALVVEASGEDAVRRVSDRFGVDAVFRLERRLGSAYDFVASRPVQAPSGVRVVAVAGIARPSSFFAALQDAGYATVQTLSFADHHRFTPADIATVERVATEHRAEYVITTDKDAERLRPFMPLTVRVVSVPLQVSVQPDDPFRTWLARLVSPTPPKAG